MKKTLAIVMILCLFLVACGTAEEPVEEPKDEVVTGVTIEMPESTEVEEPEVEVEAEEEVPEEEPEDDSTVKVVNIEKLDDVKRDRDYGQIVQPDPKYVEKKTGLSTFNIYLEVAEDLTKAEMISINIEKVVLTSNVGEDYDIRENVPLSITTKDKVLLGTIKGKAGLYKNVALTFAERGEGVHEGKTLLLKTDNSYVRAELNEQFTAEREYDITVSVDFNDLKEKVNRLELTLPTRTDSEYVLVI